MSEDYVHYTIKSSDIHGISRACSVFKTTEQLLQAYAEFIDSQELSYADTDGRIIEALNSAIYKRNIISVNRLDSDARTLFNRICADLPKFSRCPSTGKDRYYNDLRDFLTDFNWLIASEYAAEANQKIVLIKNNLRACFDTRERLAAIYNQAVESFDECKYIDEAGKIKWQLLPGLCPYEGVRKYLAQDITYEDRKNWKADYAKLYFEASFLFYALTATCIKTIEITRKYHV